MQNITIKFLEVFAFITAMALMVPAFFLIISLAKNFFDRYIFSAFKKKQHHKKMKEEIAKLIEETKGKFFSISFEKKDGSLRTINGKNKYCKMIRGISLDPNGMTSLRKAGYEVAINRNNKGWFSFKPEAVRHFKCGKIEKSFSV